MGVHRFEYLFAAAMFVILCVHAVNSSAVDNVHDIDEILSSPKTEHKISARSFTSPPEYTPAVALANQPCREFGCHKSYCWAYCGISPQWCYTTKTYSQSFQYVKCSKKEDCQGCWKCAGSCTL